MSNNKIDLNSEFYCVLCGRRGLPVVRRQGAMREAGHLKKLYCLNCGIQTNHAEVRPYTKYDYEDFKIEYEYQNFDEEGNRKRTYGQLKELIRNGKVEREKTLVDGRNSRLR